VTAAADQLNHPPRVHGHSPGTQWSPTPDVFLGLDPLPAQVAMRVGVYDLALWRMLFVDGPAKSTTPAVHCAHACCVTHTHTHTHSHSRATHVSCTTQPHQTPTKCRRPSLKTHSHTKMALLAGRLPADLPAAPRGARGGGPGAPSRPQLPPISPPSAPPGQGCAAT
jgi:hypothetical protein